LLWQVCLDRKWLGCGALTTKSKPASQTIYLLLKRVPHSCHVHSFSTDVKSENIVLTDSELKFEGKSEDKDYQVNIEFLNAVDSEGSTYKVLPRSVQMHIIKKDKEEEEFWPRLLKDKALEKNQVKIDWDRYVDEDEEEEGFDMSNLEGGSGMGGGGPPGMGGMGGPPGMGGMGGMPGMGGMGGMPGMGGMGGMPGMGGMGGGDMGGMDMEALVSFFVV
jgi:prostaglandin-E synthase